MPSNPPSAPDPYKYPMQYAAHERAHGRQPPAWCDDEALKWMERAQAAEATMREVAKELRKWGEHSRETWCFELADRLSPPPGFL